MVEGGDISRAGEQPDATRHAEAVEHDGLNKLKGKLLSAEYRKSSLEQQRRKLARLRKVLDTAERALEQAEQAAAEEADVVYKELASSQGDDFLAKDEELSAELKDAYKEANDEAVEQLFENLRRAM